MTPRFHPPPPRAKKSGQAGIALLELLISLSLLALMLWMLATATAPVLSAARRYGQILLHPPGAGLLDAAARIKLDLLCLDRANPEFRAGREEIEFRSRLTEFDGEYPGALTRVSYRAQGSRLVRRTRPDLPAGAPRGPEHEQVLWSGEQPPVFSFLTTGGWQDALPPDPTGTPRALKIRFADGGTPRRILLALP